MLEHILKKLTDPYFEVPLDAYNDASKYFINNHFKKNEIIKHKNQPETHLHLIIKGSAASFVYKDGHDICIDLFYEGDFAGDYYSMLLQYNLKPELLSTSKAVQIMNTESPIYVMALEPLETLSISKEKLFNFYKQADTGERMARMIAEVLYMQKQNQQIELLTLTAEKRYENLLKKQPNILQRTANKHIASFLGITPESFSRIRKKTIK